MGDVTLIHGDCLEIMPTLEPKSVAMVFADLPYGCAKHLNWDSDAFDINAFNAAAKPLLQTISCMVLTANMRFSAKLMSMQIPFKHDLVWRKSCPSNIFAAKRQPLSYHEHVLVFSYGKHVYNPQMIDATERRQVLANPRTFKARHKKFFGHAAEHTNRVAGPLYPRSILDKIQRDAKRKTMHPTQKPVALLEWLIKTYTQENDTVLDPVAGSGTTAIAALNTGRKAICIEKDAGYFEAMSERVAKHQEGMRQNVCA